MSTHKYLPIDVHKKKHKLPLICLSPVTHISTPITTTNNCATVKTIHSLTLYLFKNPLQSSRPSLTMCQIHQPCNCIRLCRAITFNNNHQEACDLSLNKITVKDPRKCICNLSYHDECPMLGEMIKHLWTLHCISHSTIEEIRRRGDQSDKLWMLHCIRRSKDHEANTQGMVMAVGNDERSLSIIREETYEAALREVYVFLPRLDANAWAVLKTHPVFVDLSTCALNLPKLELQRRCSIHQVVAEDAIIGE